MPNPFYYGGHVSPEQFVGRRAELARIYGALEVAHSGQMQSKTWKVRFAKTFQVSAPRSANF